ncbi:MAG: isochorismatase family protein [Archangium sp.]|nr:isochorismatase family protein [Archangium sp.]MDP3152592.1 isochorismatase family protein [Archangium sp.]MDP3571012.1 isochorismatase family protein [Archangium sp.]
MTHRFTKAAGALLVVDVQERLGAAMPADRLERVLNRTRAAIEGAKALGLPIIVTEQYPKGLGPTISAVKELIPAFAPVEKLEFSAVVPGVLQQLAPRTSVLVVGMETHVCVFQTVRALQEAGMTPYLAVDAVLSRTQVDYETGLGLCRDAGAKMTTVEAALFDALGRAGGPAFKTISAAVK